jgi:hypothetical protein
MLLLTRGYGSGYDSTELCDSIAHGAIRDVLEVFAVFVDRENVSCYAPRYCWCAANDD